MSPIETALNRFLDWLERVLPTALASFGVGYSLGKKGEKDLKKKLLEANYELEKSKNAEIVRRENAGKTAQAIVDEYLGNSKRGNGS